MPITPITITLTDDEAYELDWILNETEQDTFVQSRADACASILRKLHRESDGDSDDSEARQRADQHDLLSALPDSVATAILTENE